MTVRDVLERESDRNAIGAVLSRVRFDEFRRTGIAIAQMATDGLLVPISASLSLCFTTFVLRHEGIHFYLYVFPTVAATVVLVFNFARSGAYDIFNTYGRLGLLRSTIRRLLEVVLLLTFCFFVFKVSDSFSRLWLATWSLTSAIGLCGARLVFSNAVDTLIKRGELAKNIAIVGASEAGQRLSVKLMREASGTRLIGLFDQRHPSRIASLGSGSVTAHPLETLDELLSIGRVDEVIIAIPPCASERIAQLSRRFHPFPVSLRVFAPEGYEHYRVLDSLKYGDITTFRVMSKPLDDVAVVIKWLEDKIITLLCLIAVLPIMALIALSIKLDSRGPVLFRQKRIGINNQTFNLLKFRSMYVEQADPLGNQLTRPGDPRITRVGRFLRRTSLDELPQLINVLLGDMSLVGPRPHALAASAAGVSYAHAVGDYWIRHRMKPGITGWAQVNGWRGETTRIEQIRRRVEHDVYYIENWSPAFDFIILARTIFIVMSRENAI
jgi:Undecaprenyl-phosphate glucose phosphotransferase